MTHPYMPLYVDDYEAATAHLSVEEDGAYCRLLRLCWRTPGCALPNDPTWIARKIRMSAEEFSRVAQPVIDEFFCVSRGKLIQKRLRSEYDDISRKKAARKSAGKRGGEAKARKTLEKSPSNATDLPPDTRAFQSQNHNQNHKVGVVEARESAVDDWPAGETATEHAARLVTMDRNLDTTRRQGLILTMGEVARWRQLGWSWELDVVPVVKAHGQRAGPDPVSTWKFFTEAIGRAHAARTRPAETFTPQAMRQTHDRPDHAQQKFDQRQAAHAADFEGARRAAERRAEKLASGL